MNLRRTIAAAATGLALAGGVLAGAPAQAAPSPSSAYFTITGSTDLAVSVPNPAGGVNLGTVAAGTPLLTGSLGSVTVTDNRAALVAAWTAKVTATDFVHELAGTTPPANAVVPKASILYTAGLPTATTGTGAFVPGVTTLASLTPEAEALQIAGTWAGVGSNSATWNPTLAFTLLNSQVAGKYTGQITHSVA